MPDEPGAPPPAGDAGTPPAGAPPSTPPSDPPAADPPSPPAGDAVTAKELEQARKDAAGYREKLRAAEEQLKKHEDAKLSDIEKATKERDEAVSRLTSLETQLKEQALRNAVFAEATKLGVIDPDAAFVLLPKDALKYDDGKVSGVDKALADLVKAKPYLVKEITGGNQTSQARSGNPTGDQATKEADYRKVLYGGDTRSILGGSVSGS